MGIPQFCKVDQTYAQSCATPDSALEFALTLSGLYRDYRLKFRGAGFEAMPRFFQQYVSVQGEDGQARPYSQVTHLAALERQSEDWDLESTSLDVLMDLEAVLNKLKAMDSSFDLARAIVSYPRLQQINCETRSRTVSCIKASIEAGAGRAVEPRSRGTVEAQT